MIDIVAVGSLILAIIGVAIYHILEVLTLFRILSLNMVVISNFIWPAIYLCLGIAVCSFILSFFMRDR